MRNFLNYAYFYRLNKKYYENLNLMIESANYLI